MYDVLAIVGAMEALKIDATAVIDAIGGMTASSLDALRGAGVPFVSCMSVKRALAASAGTASSTAVPAQVSQGVWFGRGRSQLSNRERPCER